jgi:gamma-glutamyltranspeptidase / glutathione hydrolase
MQYTPPPHVTQHWTISKKAARGRRGMVVSQSRAAAEAGVAVLDAGGNAVDAAVATALALPAVEPWNSGLGGIGFALVHKAGERVAEVTDFGPRAPAGLDPSRFRLTGRMTKELFAWPEVEGDANMHGPLSFVIPSAVAGYESLHRRHGRLPLAEVIAPAIALAQRGLPADWYTTLKIANAAPVLRKYAESARIYLPDGLPRAAPEQGVAPFFKLGNLAETLERLGRKGLRDFYEGETAAIIADDIKAMGGLVTAADLRECQARMRPAQEVAWRGRTLQMAGGLTASPTFARVCELMGDAAYGAAPDAAWYRALARALKQAYVERLAGIGEAEPKAAESCTTHLTVCDEAGTMVAMTTTLLSTMGSRVVLPGSGVLMNNGVMWFDPRPGQPNSMAPGKRPLSNMSPIILRDGEGPMLAGGASGGRRILAAVFQLMTYIADFGMDPEAAADHPRIDVSDPDEATADQRLAPEVLDALRAEGKLEIVQHTVMPVNFANPNMILQKGGERVGVADAVGPWSAPIAQA